jgi:hypothetical protein
MSKKFREASSVDKSFKLLLKNFKNKKINLKLKNKMGPLTNGGEFQIYNFFKKLVKGKKTRSR